MSLSMSFNEGYIGGSGYMITISCKQAINLVLDSLEHDF